MAKLKTEAKPFNHKNYVCGKDLLFLVSMA